MQATIVVFIDGICLITLRAQPVNNHSAMRHVPSFHSPIELWTRFSCHNFVLIKRCVTIMSYMCIGL